MLKHVTVITATLAILMYFLLMGHVRLYYCYMLGQVVMRLDGLDFIAAQYWAKAIHQGNGTTQLFVTIKAADGKDRRS
jgi:hypothetical protein